MIDARARAIDSVILFFYRIYLNGKKLTLSVVVVLLQLLLKMGTTNSIRKRFFCSLKRINTYLRSTTSQRLNHLMLLHIHLNLAKDLDVRQVANNTVLKKSVKNDQFVQSLNWILRIYKYVIVLKKSLKTDQFV